MAIAGQVLEFEKLYELATRRRLFGGKISGKEAMESYYAIGRAGGFQGDFADTADHGILQIGRLAVSGAIDRSRARECLERLHQQFGDSGFGGHLEDALEMIKRSSAT